MIRVRQEPGLGGAGGGAAAQGAAAGAMMGMSLGPIGAAVGAVVGAAMGYFAPGAPRPPSQLQLQKLYRDQQLLVQREIAISGKAAAGASRSRVLKYTLIGGGGLLLLGGVAVVLASRTRTKAA